MGACVRVCTHHCVHVKVRKTGRNWFPFYYLGLETELKWQVPLSLPGPLVFLGPRLALNLCQCSCLSFLQFCWSKAIVQAVPSVLTLSGWRND